MVALAVSGFRNLAKMQFRATALVFVLSAVAVPHTSWAQTPDSGTDKGTKPVKPPHEPVQQGFRLAAALGLSMMQNGKYSYETTVTAPGSGPLTYAGSERSYGGTLFLGIAATPGGALRRLTLGCDLNFGGLAAWSRPVIPAGAATPFSQNNLNQQVSQKSLTSSPWHPFFAPYVEHELASVFNNRARIGYEYMQTSRTLRGSFAANQPPSVQAGYSVHFTQRTHLIRLSIHNDTWFDEGEPGQVPRRRRSGLIQEGGLLVGTDGSVVVFVGVGPVWTF
jgi:hypothetical protein